MIVGVNDISKTSLKTYLWVEVHIVHSSSIGPFSILKMKSLNTVFGFMFTIFLLACTAILGLGNKLTFFLFVSKPNA